MNLVNKLNIKEGTILRIKSALCNGKVKVDDIVVVDAVYHFSDQICFHYEGSWEQGYIAQYLNSRFEIINL